MAIYGHVDIYPTATAPDKKAGLWPRTSRLEGVDMGGSVCELSICKGPAGALA